MKKIQLKNEIIQNCRKMAVDENKINQIPDLSRHIMLKMKNSLKFSLTKGYTMRLKRNKRMLHDKKCCEMEFCFFIDFNPHLLDKILFK